jgi:hypothetical protein
MTTCLHLELRLVMRGAMPPLQHTVAYLLKARTAEPEKQPLLANDSETRFVSRQWICMQQQGYCWKRCFLLGPSKGVIRKTIGATETVQYRSL